MADAGVDGDPKGKEVFVARGEKAIAAGEPDFRGVCGALQNPEPNVRVASPGRGGIANCRVGVQRRLAGWL